MACGNKENVAGLLLNVGDFGGPESSARNMDVGTHGATDRPHRREDTRAKQMDRTGYEVSHNDGE